MQSFCGRCKHVPTADAIEKRSLAGNLKIALLGTMDRHRQSGFREQNECHQEYYLRRCSNIHSILKTCADDHCSSTVGRHCLCWCQFMVLPPSTSATRRGLPEQLVSAFRYITTIDYIALIVINWRRKIAKIALA